MGRYGVTTLLVAASMLLCVTQAGAGQLVMRGSGRAGEETRKLNRVTSVALHCVGDLTIELADREELRIEAEDNLLEFLETKVVDGELRISQSQDVVLRPSRPVRFHLSVRGLERLVFAAGGQVLVPRLSTQRLEVRHTGSGRIELTDLQADLLFVHLSGSGDLWLEHVEVQRCRLTLSGSGDLKVGQLLGLSNSVRLTGSGNLEIKDGSVVQQSAIVSGSGEYKGLGLGASQSEVMVSGSGSARVQARDELDATLTGRGDIHYLGDPHVTQSRSGDGRLKRMRG